MTEGRKHRWTVWSNNAKENIFCSFSAHPYCIHKVLTDDLNISDFTSKKYQSIAWLIHNTLILASFTESKFASGFESHLGGEWKQDRAKKMNCTCSLEKLIIQYLNMLVYNLQVYESFYIYNIFSHQGKNENLMNGIITVYNFCSYHWAVRNVNSIIKLQK